MVTDHWSIPVRNASRKAMNVFQKVDPRLTNISVKEVTRESENTRLGTWRLLAEAAQKKGCNELFVGELNESLDVVAFRRPNERSPSLPMDYKITLHEFLDST
jgi:hypothetical protein